MKKLTYWLIIALILIGVSSATEQPKQNLTYNDHGLFFYIPANWSIAEDEQIHRIQFDGTPMNDTKIVLTDGISAIRIDIVEIPQLNWLRKAFGEEIYHLEDGLGKFYSNQVLNMSDSRRSSSGGTELTVHPDDSQYTYFRVFDENTEWLVLWTKPDYGNKFIGIHSIHDRKYPTVKLNIYKREYYMQTSLYIILNNLTAGEPLAQSIVDKDLISKV